jgi:N-acetylmuramoyl-L-alanine amidase
MGHHRRILLDSEAGVYRYDELIVLRRTSTPAALLEAGSIVNRQEELELGTPERRSLTSAAVAHFVRDCLLTAPRSHHDDASKQRLWRVSTP